jgi:kumamolisin
MAECDPSETLRVTVLLRGRSRERFDALVEELAAGVRPRVHLSREEFAREFGADPKDAAAVKRFLQGGGLSVVSEDLARRTLVVSGTVAQFSRAFGVTMQRYQYDGGTYRGRTGPVYVPEEMTGLVEGVFGLDDRPQASTHFRIAPKVRAGAVTASFTPPQVARLYAFPSGTSAAGQCIGIVELGGGYQAADVAQYFANLNVPAPNVTAVSVDGAKNAPTGDPNGPDVEVMLDIEVAGAVAAGSKLAVYFAPNTDAGFLNGITTAVHDEVNRPSVISISWGGSESTWTQQATTAMNSALQAAATMGVTVCIASGDNGASDGVSGGGNHVDFPASSPFALACGGTTLKGAGDVIAGEVVWNDGASGGATGGGVSAVFALPRYQQGLTATGVDGKQSSLQARGVPDVAGDADPQTGYDVRVDGENAVVGGTSAVAPLWAALVALVNARNGKPVGFINPQLYTGAGSLNDITQGNNGGFAATSGWDACTGLGTPDGEKVLAVLSSSQK